MGYIYKQRGRRSYMMRYVDAAGIAHRASCGTDDEKEAQKQLRAKETDVDRGVPVGKTIGKLTLADAQKGVEADYKVNEQGSVADLKRRFNLHLIPFFGGARKMTTIATAELRHYIAWRMARHCGSCEWIALDEDDEARTDCPQCAEPVVAGAAKATINRELAALKRAFNLAIEDAKLLYVPYFPMLDESDNVREGFFEREMFEAIRDRLPIELRDMATFCYCTGWRVDDEVLTLDWPQVDMKAGTVRLYTSKNGKGRLFPFDVYPELRTALQNAERARVDLCAPVFHRNGKRIVSFRGSWANACTDAGYPQMIPHDFRRTAVRNLVRAGVPEKTAMMLTGHKTRSVFDRYHIVNEEDLRSAVSRLAIAAAAPPAAAEAPAQKRRKGRVLRYERQSAGRPKTSAPGAGKKARG